MKLILDDGTEHELVQMEYDMIGYYPKDGIRKPFPTSQTPIGRQIKGWSYKAFVIDGKFYAVK